MKRTVPLLAQQFVTKLSRIPVLECPFVGKELLSNPRLNKGTAFTLEERKIFHLEGLLPAAVNSLEQQVNRAYRQFKECSTDLAKNSFCESMRKQNEILYFKMIQTHLKEMFSIIYTPTQGEAIEKYSRLFRRPEGVFLDVNYPEDIESRMLHYGEWDDIDYIVVTDSEAILGIGDQGTGGIGISIAKLALMTICGGVHPNRVIPVCLDVGTNNEEKLNDPLYLGNRMRRVEGARYDELVDNFIQTVKRVYPLAVVHFEDFGVKNAYRILQKYRDELPCFNDDIQGTGAVTLSAINAAMKSIGSDVSEAKILIYGAGSAGVGIATQIVNHLTTKGATEEEARQHIYLMDRPGLLVKSLGEGGLSESQLPYAKDDSAWNGIDKKSLLEVVKKVKPNVLIGTSTQAGAFTEEVVREMASHVERPIILPLSNPTRLHEAVPADLLKWTNGRAMVATGSPFHPVDGRPISENNNCFIFPGIGLGAVLSRASSITNGMIAAAVDTLSEMSPVIHDPEGGLLPEVDDIFEISAKIATSVVLQAVKEGVARVGSERSPYTNEPVMVPDSYNNCLRWVKSQMWMPEYRPLRKSSHRW